MSVKYTVFWITGASSGIGKSLAIELSKENTRLILSSRNEKELEKVKNQCGQPKNVSILPLDLEDYAFFSDKVVQAISFFGKIDVLVNNGGVSQRSFAKDTSIKVDERLMKINY